MKLVRKAWERKPKETRIGWMKMMHNCSNSLMRRGRLFDSPKPLILARQEGTVQEYRAKVQQVTRKPKNQWWMEKANEIQKLADANDTSGFFNATKVIFGSSTQGQAPLKSKDGSKILISRVDIES